MGYTPLMLAVKNNMQDMVDDLLAAEAQVDIVDKRMKTAMHWAGLCQQRACHQSLLTAGANKDAQDEFEQTPLFLAAREGAKEAVEVLLAAGANRDITDHCDKLPRDAATSLEHYDIVALAGWNECSDPQQSGWYGVPERVPGARPQALTMMQRAETAQENASKGTLKKKSSARSRPAHPPLIRTENGQSAAAAGLERGRQADPQTLGRNKGSNGGNSNHRRSSSAARATSKNTMESSAASQLQQLQQQHQQQTQHTSPVSVPMTRDLCSHRPPHPVRCRHPRLAGIHTVAAALGGVLVSLFHFISRLISPLIMPQHPSLSFPSVPMTQGFASIRPL